ncbi:uncharacterized protein STEHIDRAFT_19980, partial [Stereum hirsutum FP-91666 SS1]
NQPTGAFTGKPETGTGPWYSPETDDDNASNRGWCGYPTSNDNPIFAPSLSRMSPDNATYATDPAGWHQATCYYCGLEANITNPSNGVTALLYIGDVFD